MNPATWSILLNALAICHTHAVYVPDGHNGFVTKSYDAGFSQCAELVPAVQALLTKSFEASEAAQDADDKAAVAKGLAALRSAGN